MINGMILIEIFNFPFLDGDVPRSPLLPMVYIFYLLFTIASAMLIYVSKLVSIVSLSLSHWYPGSGVVLDCIDS